MTNFNVCGPDLPEGLPVLLWSQTHPEPFQLWGVWDEAIEIWWIFSDQAVEDWLGDIDGLDDIAETAREFCEDAGIVFGGGTSWVT